MSEWFTRVSTRLRERLGSVVVATALAALIVLGVLAVLIATVTSSQRAFADASETVAAAEATEDAIVATAALQRERALASSLADADLYMYHQGYDASIVDTDRGMQTLRASWAEHRSEISETATPSIGDVLSADASLADFREAALSTTGESTYPLYTEVVATSVAATSELIKQSSDATTLENRSLLVALLALSERLNAQRHLIQEALATGGPVSEEIMLQLQVEFDNLSQSFFAVRALADGEDLAVIEGIRTGEASHDVARMVEAITERGVAVESISPQQWFEASTVRIEQVDGLIPAVHERVATVAGEELDRAERALWTRSILLSALFLLTVLVGGNAVFATRERQQVLTEYGQLSDGLRQWFAPTSFPDPESVGIAARYIPASVRTQSGGDWYDVYEVGDSLAVVIGDVAGHGADATAQMAQLRNVLRGQSTARTLDPAAQIDLLDKTMSGSGIVATMTYGLLDVSNGEFVYTRAGHVPLLIRSSAGDVRIEEEAPGPPVGGEVDLTRELKRTRLYPGDVLILITDGLVEGLNRDIDEALDQIAKTLTEADPSPEA
ncbi:MAG TPA: SpoIIE family protein phosphatase, partial [Acidimicrobiia bacterium]|nr:SpoIIE family protein phosphatase [Acidimicrobiia bacterium]